MTGGALYVKSQLQIGDVSIGPREPLALISGLNVLEDERATVEMARKIQEIAQERGMPLVFKASFDKANRTRSDGFRGPGLAEGLRILQIVK